MLTEKKQKNLWAAVHRFKKRALKADGVERQKYLLRARRCLSALNFSFYGRDHFDDVRCWPILSVRQPWAELILRGVKVCENRTFPLPERHIHRHILLHASRQVDTLPETLRQHIGADVPCDGLPRGCIVGVVSFSPVNQQWETRPKMRALLEPWAFTGFHVWEIVAFWRFPVPIPARGALGFFNRPFDDSSILRNARAIPPTGRKGRGYDFTFFERAR